MGSAFIFWFARHFQLPLCVWPYPRREYKPIDRGDLKTDELIFYKILALWQPRSAVALARKNLYKRVLQPLI